ncbi:hypothetical protein JHK84_049377 [Glycine max]|nr:hypothetical protein JHK84_049377 [Glycine max]
MSDKDFFMRALFALPEASKRLILFNSLFPRWEDYPPQSKSLTNAIDKMIAQVQKMRKSLKHYIWKVKPNPPRRENDDLEDYNKPDEIFDQNNGAEKIDKEHFPLYKSRNSCTLERILHSPRNSIKQNQSNNEDFPTLWHGLRMLRNPWADGPSYVTQCPIQPGGSYTYRFRIRDQEGTLWWHAHTGFLRATVYGAFIIYPRLGSPYPFSMPKQEVPLLLANELLIYSAINRLYCDDATGEWFDTDLVLLQRQADFAGLPPNTSVAYTINGQPGDLYRCSSQETVRVPVDAGETIMLRIISSTLNQELFFSIANHTMTVVGTDAAYTKPFKTTVLMIGPGQTFNVIVTADQPPGFYYMAAHAYESAVNAPFDNTTTTAILEYRSTRRRNQNRSRPVLPALPAFNDTPTATAFTARIRGLTRVRVFKKVDVNLYFIVGLGLINCTNPNSPRCQGPNGTRFTASMNNVSFVLPSTTSLMQAYYEGIPGVFTTDFPPVPPLQFDYTGNVPPGLWTPSRGTKLYKVKYGSKVQIVLQDTSIVTTEEHPMHVHGFHFFVVGSGFGNFNPATDPLKFNLVDPPVRNTIGTPPGGWVAIRFVADNPGNLLYYCITLSSSAKMELAFHSQYYLHHQIYPNVKVNEASLVNKFIVLYYKFYKNLPNKQYGFLQFPIPELDYA